jgi:NAD(P)-dependent dehydrogenase (short-subunit alcohol dehydrogenase family)
VRDTVKANGRIDVLHNNAGIGTGDASAHKIEIEAWDRILAVNLKSDKQELICRENAAAGQGALPSP